MFEAIREHVWRPAREPHLTRVWFPEDSGAHRAEWAYVVEAGLEPVVRSLQVVGRDGPFEAGAFSEHLWLNRFDPDGDRSIWAAAAALSWFEVQGYAPSVLPRSKTPLPADVAALLQESGGAVVWDHQAERLAALGGVAPDETAAFRGALARRSRSAWDRAGQLALGDGVSVADVLGSRSPAGELLSVPLDLVRARQVRDALRAGP